jgi:diguanylate cyclase (GGDEF)-like protein/PAS domain S-box-containing protein
MTRPNSTGNRRILVIDDNEAIQQDFRKILGSDETGAAALVESEAALFGESAPQRQGFELDSAYQGEGGLAMVVRALAESRPYALAFVDTRMPPGWDGVETIERLWQVDPQLQIVLCTAYSDYSWETLSERLDLSDRLLILKKPFDNIEIRQMASALTVKWQMTRDAAFKMDSLEKAVEERTKELSDANLIIQNSPTILYRLRGEPALPLIYISHNITKFGYDPATLLASPDWAEKLIVADDRDKVGAAMARVMEKDAAGASIEFRMRTGGGAYRWVENRYIPVRDADGRLIEVEGIIIDITERRAAEEKIAQLARTDGLTGLANRATFIERLAQTFASARRGAIPFAVLYLDLDHFKSVNDSLGHPVGDLLLREVAHRLRRCTRESDLVARLGGDEFAVLQGEMGDPTNAGALAGNVQKALAVPYRLNGNDVHISVSIGICPYVADSAGADAMLEQADLALYRSKQEGRNRYHFHTDNLDQEVLERITLADDLRRALDNGELQLYYQPQIELCSGTIIGMEALARWNHPTRGLLTADAFIPTAEKTGAIIALGHWVLDQACQQMRCWRDAGIAPPVIAINLSLAELRRGDAFVRDVLDTLEKWRLAPSDLEFDVAEATLAQVKWAHADVLPQLRELGVMIAIDDFGTEYSSIGYLRSYRMNHLKIAPSLVSKATGDPRSAATIRAIINLAREVGVGVIAEGVETEAQRDLLVSASRTTDGQGFYFSEAVGIVRATELLRQGGVAVAARNEGACFTRDGVLL